MGRNLKVTKMTLIKNDYRGRVNTWTCGYYNSLVFGASHQINVGNKNGNVVDVHIAQVVRRIFLIVCKILAHVNLKICD